MITTASAIIAALILPIPFFHLWLHGLLPLWRRRPLLLYLFGVALWVGAFTMVPIVEGLSPQAFDPAPWVQSLGGALIIIGFLFAAWSLATLGPTRFFVWAVIRPGIVEKIRIAAGPFRFLPHPAYMGYVTVAFGNLLRYGELYLGGMFVLLFFLTPIVIWLEEHELQERLEAK